MMCICVASLVDRVGSVNQDPTQKFIKNILEKYITITTRYLYKAYTAVYRLIKMTQVLNVKHEEGGLVGTIAGDKRVLLSKPTPCVYLKDQAPGTALEEVGAKANEDRSLYYHIGRMVTLGRITAVPYSTFELRE